MVQKGIQAGILRKHDKIRVAILDLGIGNVASIQTCLLRAGVGSDIVPSLGGGSRPDILVLPGVGNFARGVRQLDHGNMRDAITSFVEGGGGIIGICLGMQLLGEGSEESHGSGLGLLPFFSRRLVRETQGGVSLTGWQVPIVKDMKFLDLSGLERYYFMHDFGLVEVDAPFVAMTHVTPDGTKVASAVSAEGVIGFQFHPERSLEFGTEILGKAVRQLAK